MKDATEATLKRAREDGVRFVLLQFTDIHGTLKSVSIPVHKLEESLRKGTWFDGSSIEGFTRIAESDMFLKPDTNTYALVPWEAGEQATARFICDVYTPDGCPFEGDPRYILKRVMKEAHDMGYVYNVGPELEFFLFKSKEDSSPVTHDRAGYFDFSPRDLAVKVRNDIVKTLESMGLEVETSHHEVAPGQHEIDFKYDDALTQADRAITFKHVVKSVAQSCGLHASFMPKPLFGVNGSGMHVHQSLFDSKTKKNVFYDAEDPYRISSIARNFIAGQFAHIKAMTAIIAPTVNSYKRLVPGYEAPVYICWAQVNRSALIRIPRYSPGREQSTRAELRCPDPSCNPYLAFAVMLKAGLDGIKKGLEPPAPIEEDVYKFDDAQRQANRIETLPDSLGEAIKALDEDRVMQETLGTHTYPIYVAAKRAEYDEYRLRVTSWEIEKYFETV